MTLQYLYQPVCFLSDLLHDAPGTHATMVMLTTVPQGLHC